MLLRPPLADISTYRLVDAFTEKSFEYLLGVASYAAMLQRPGVLCVVTSRHIQLFECLDVGVYRCDVFVSFVSVENIV